MKYIRPHLSPELRAHIAPETRRSRRSVIAGMFFLGLSVLLVINLLSNDSSDSNSTRQLAQFQSTLTQDNKQVLGLTTLDEQPAEQTQDLKEEFTTYVVKNGDTLFNISQKYGVNWDLIAQINALPEPYLLQIGQTLKIPQATTSKLDGKIYTIKKGDTLASIARSFNITVSDVIAVNPNLQSSDLITVGQVIKLP